MDTTTGCHRATLAIANKRLERPHQKSRKRLRRHTQIRCLLAVAIADVAGIRDAIELIMQATHSTVRENKRKRRSTFDLLNDTEMLEYSLT